MTRRNRDGEGKVDCGRAVPPGDDGRVARRRSPRALLRKAPRALLCFALAASLAFLPAAQALAQAGPLPAPAVSSLKGAKGVTVSASGATIEGTFVSKGDFLAAIAKAKHAAYPQAPSDKQAAWAGRAAPGTAAPAEPRPAVLAPLYLTGAPLSPASIGWGAGTAEAVESAVIIRKGLEAIVGAALDKAAFAISAMQARETAWSVAVDGVECLFAFTDADELILLVNGAAYSIAPCWLSIAVAQYAAAHVSDPVEGGGEAPPATLDDILDGATHSPEKPGSDTDQWEKPGGYDDALADYGKLRPSDSHDIDTPYGSGKMGKLPNGDTVVARRGSSLKSGGHPTLEIQHKEPGPGGKQKTKIRYTG